MKLLVLIILSSAFMIFNIAYHQLAVERNPRAILVHEINQLNAKKANPDRNIRSGAAKVKFEKFETADYLHLVFVNKNDKVMSFFATDDRITYFIIETRGEWIDIEFEALESFIPEGGGYYPIQRIVNAKKGNLTFYSWWEGECKRSSKEEAEVKYENILEKLIMPMSGVNQKM